MTDQFDGIKDRASVGTPLWVKLLLVVSLASNLLIAGIVIGALAARGGGPVASLPRDGASNAFLQALPEADRAEIRRSFIREMRTLDRAQIRSEMRWFLALLKQDPFDRLAVAEAIAQQRTRTSDRVELGDRLFIDRLEAMSVEDRRAYAERLEEVFRRMARRND